MSSNFTNKLNQAKLAKQANGLFRTRTLLKNDAKYNFSSNDYLSLTNDPKVKAFYQNAFANYPTGSTGSVVISGYSNAQAQLESKLADALEVDACMLFSSGYAANLAVVSLLAENAAQLVIDKSVHASIYDGIKLSGAKYTRYLHNDLQSLQSKVQNFSADIDLAVITESIFSMSGQIADLAQIKQVIVPYNTNLIVDEAHAFGVVGARGLGAVAAAGLTQEDVPLRIIPLGKAGAGFGALVAGSGIWIESLLQMRSAVYSTAVSPAFAYGLLETIEYIQSLDTRRAKLQSLISYFKTLIAKSGLMWRDSASHIQQLQLGCPYKACALADGLCENGIICMPIREPTVRRHETGLRVILNYQHELEDLDYLFACLQKLLA